MIEIQLSDSARIPLYQQIVEQVKQLVATTRIQTGEHLPTVRQLASSLGINQGTVMRAYLELKKEGIVVSRRRGGTIVVAGSDDPRMLALRRKRLSNMVSNNILESLSLGYTPEELEATFSLHLARWHEERKIIKQAPGDQIELAPTNNSIFIAASHDLALDLLASQLRYKRPEIVVQITYAGSLSGLISLREGRADVAGIHLLDEETGKYNYPYVKRIFPGVEMIIVHFIYRIQGLMVAEGNPKQIKGLEDLRRPDITMVNRQKGSGTRVLLDLKLQEMGISPGDRKGYQHELDTHLAVASSIASGMADVGLGIEAAALSYGLDFLPLFKERYDLVMASEKYHSEPVSALLEVLGGDEFRETVTKMGGYDASETGVMVLVK